MPLKPSLLDPCTAGTIHAGNNAVSLRKIKKTQQASNFIVMWVFIYTFFIIPLVTNPWIQVKIGHDEMCFTQNWEWKGNCRIFAKIHAVAITEYLLLSTTMSSAATCVRLFYTLPRSYSILVWIKTDVINKV